MAYVKHAPQADNKKKIALATICVLLVLTIFTAVVGLLGMNVSADGLYKLIPWIPSLSTGWYRALPPNLDFGTGIYNVYTAPKAEGVTDADYTAGLIDTVNTIKQRFTLLGIRGLVAREGDEAIRVTVAAADYSADLFTLVSSKADVTFVDPQGNTFMANEHIKSANFGKATSTATTYSLQFTFTDEGKQLLADKTAAAAAGSAVAITVNIDGASIGTITANQPITGGTALISGIELATAQKYSIQLNSGNLAFTLTAGELNTSEALLGPSLLGTLVIIVAEILFIAAVWFVLRYKVGGLLAAWSLAVMVIFFFFMTGATAISAGARLTPVNAAVIVLCLALCVYSIQVLFSKFSMFSGRGRAPHQAMIEAFSKGSKTVYIVHGALIFLAFILMVIFKRAEFGLTGRILSLGVIANFIVVFIFLRALMQNTANLLVGRMDLLCPTLKK
jgi:preprotein translocase subunit SecD